MGKSLRDDLLKLIAFEPGKRGVGYYRVDDVQAILDRHPPADGVVMPRDLLSDLRDLASDAVIHHHAAMAGHEPDVHAENDRIIEQADAILAEGNRTTKERHENPVARQ